MSSCNGSKSHFLQSLPFLKALRFETEQFCLKRVFYFPTLAIAPFHNCVVAITKTKTREEFFNPTNYLLKLGLRSGKTSCLLNFSKQLFTFDYLFSLNWSVCAFRHGRTWKVFSIEGLNVLLRLRLFVLQLFSKF